MARRRFDWNSLAGVGLAGALLGLLLGSAILGWALWRVALSREGRRPPATAEGALLQGLDAAALRELRARRLQFPVEGIGREALVDSFLEARGAGSRRHHAVDILAPRRTPVRAVEAGTVARLLTGGAGGISLYQFDPGRRYCYYYAHLDGYAPGLREGSPVQRGQVLGYVGSTGNAPRTAPHLHFAIFRVDLSEQWWGGRALNPYPVLR